MSRNATPAMQNDIGTCLKTFENERSCSFPHRHGDATIKPENRYETCWSLKTSVSCENSLNFHTLLLQNQHFPTSFLINRPKIDHLKIDVSCQASVNFHHICLTMRFAKNTQHDTSEMLRLPRKMVTKCHQSAALGTKKRNSSSKNEANVTQSDVRHVMKPAGMSQSATPATRHEATRRLKLSKVTLVAELARGTATRSSCGRLRTVANGLAPSGEHTLNPQTPRVSRVKREPLLRIREKWYPYACQEVVSRESCGADRFSMIQLHHPAFYLQDTLQVPGSVFQEYSGLPMAFDKVSYSSCR